MTPARPRDPGVTRAHVQVLIRTTAAASLAASAVHAVLIEQHLEEWWGYGAFFILASLAQGFYGLVLFALPRRPSWAGPEWTAWTRRLYWAGIAGNASVIALYAITRTVGIPFLGPAAGEVEPVAAIDLWSKATEVLVILLLGVLIHGARTRTAAPGVTASTPDAAA